jgi:hypothetical protein
MGAKGQHLNSFLGMRSFRATLDLILSFTSRHEGGGKTGMKIFLLAVVSAVCLPAQDVVGRTVEPSGSGSALLAPGTIAPAAKPLPEFTPLSNPQKFQLYLREFTRPSSYLGPAFGATVQHFRDRPEEWDQGATGLSQRYGDRLARGAVRDSVRYAAGVLLNEDPRYYRTTSPRVSARVVNALRNTFLTRKDDGTLAPAYGRIGANYAGAFASNLWLPDRVASNGQAMRRGTWRMGTELGMNFLREFWPDVRRKLFRKRSSGSVNRSTLGFPEETWID